MGKEAMPLDKTGQNRETEVWQRVNGCCPPEGGDIRPLLLAAAETLGAYRQLAQLLTGGKRERMKGLLAVSRRSLEGLRGIQRMSGYPAEKLRTAAIPGESARRLLERSYHRALRQMTEYTARMLDPDYGTVFRTLADRERDAAVVLAELIGGLEE